MAFITTVLLSYFLSLLYTSHVSIYCTFYHHHHHHPTIRWRISYDMEMVVFYCWNWVRYTLFLSYPISLTITNTPLIHHGDGRFLLLKLAKVSHLYRNINQTAERVRNGDIVLDLSSMEKVRLPYSLLTLSSSRSSLFHPSEQRSYLFIDPSITHPLNTPS